MGLVLGAGGVAGGAFHAGVLAALDEGAGWDARRAAVIVGTSAGSVTGTTLRAGLSAADLLARSEERPLSAEGAALMGSVGPPQQPPPLRPPAGRRSAGEVAAVLRRTARRPLAVRPSALVASLVPDGGASTEAIARAIAALFPDDWPPDPLWICAVRRSDGRRVVFGRDDRPPLPAAVAASCAIPGFYAPVDVGGEPHIDGGAHSPTNLDVLVPSAADLDLVVVSSPMSHRVRRPGATARDGVRHWSALLLRREVAALRRRGVPVLAFEPGPADLAAVGSDAMDPGRRAAVARQAFDSTLRRLGSPRVAERVATLGR